MSQTAHLLFELGTEELPPKALLHFIRTLEDKICTGLDNAKLSYSQCEIFATPRRLAVLIYDVPKQQPDQMIERRGPALSVAFPNGRDNAPSKAAEGFARSCGTTVDQLAIITTDKGEWLSYTLEQKGLPLSELIIDIIHHALDNLPIPKRMRWGNRKAQFVRPIHWAVLMHGSTVIETDILSVKTANQSFGHRFHHPENITITSAQDYQSQLRDAYVIASFAERKALIKQQVQQKAQQLNGHAKIDDELLNEVTALVEWPVALAAQFEERFLTVPQEALISTMESNQKYFTLFDDQHKLMPWFITISNIESKDESQVIKGNQRVVRPRLADAAFFFETDKKQTLTEHAKALETMIFQNQLGTLTDKCQRISQLAGIIAEYIDADTTIAKEAGLLAKADLVTNMVYEFTELQGTMGYYYALHEGKPDNFAKALYEQYLPRFAGDDLPETKEGMCLALADKLDTLVGIIGIGQIPTGDKDPFAFRRASLGFMRILIERALPLNIKTLIQSAINAFGNKLSNSNVLDDVIHFFEARYRAWYQEQAIDAITVQSVQAIHEMVPMEFDARVKAVAIFQTLPEAEALAAANKRVNNILAKADEEIAYHVDEDLLVEPAEQILWHAICEKQQEQKLLLAKRDYQTALSALANLREPVDTFFDCVMVNVENAQLKENRLALLNQLSLLFKAIADISVLSL